MTSFVVFDLPTFHDDRGSLTVLDDVLPFTVKRVYWVYGAGGQSRGGHRHNKTRQALIAVAGSIVVHMDDGQAVSDIVLDRPDRCLLVEPKDWHVITFGGSSILLVAASHPYDKADYIDAAYRQTFP